MATLLLGALGTLVGGPIGGAIGALAGQQVDRAIIGSPHREGPRLKELSVTTSSYGTPIPRQHGRMRVAGSIIWATDLAESSEESGGGKGQPSITTYNYSASFAVALSSRPIQQVGRIWADGNLLRGATGDLKSGGTLRVYEGWGDHPVDPLIAADKGAACPAFRGLAYIVFEDLQLADFGNRIPALTFEIEADTGEVALAELVSPLPERMEIDRPLTALQGFTLEGGAVVDSIAAIDSVYPIAMDAGAGGLVLKPADALPSATALLPQPAISLGEGDFGAQTGALRRRAPASEFVPDALRYYDVDRDYQAGVQRADGRARPGRSRSIEFPGALASSDARGLVNAAAERAGWNRDTLAWRMAELDPALTPGTVVRVPDRAGLWRIEAWEWREHGVELELRRMPRGPAREPAADPGQVLSAPDLAITPTLLEAFELPWDGTGTGDAPAQFAAVSSSGAGWRGAALYADVGGSLTSLGGSGSRRSIIGQTTAALPASPSLVLERDARLEIQLASADFVLSGASPAAVANGANRALLGGEIIQFATAVALGGGLWRLEGLLRGRGGTELVAQAAHPAGTPFALLDGTPVALDNALVGHSAGATITAIGLGDATPVSSPIANPGITRRPLSPVHPLAIPAADGSLALYWTRRARGAWNWPDEVETPLLEQSEAYLVGLGSVANPALSWEVAAPTLTLDSASFSNLQATHPGQEFWVRQVGSYAQSDPLLLFTLP